MVTTLKLETLVRGEHYDGCLSRGFPIKTVGNDNVLGTVGNDGVQGSVGNDGVFTTVGNDRVY